MVANAKFHGKSPKELCFMQPGRLVLREGQEKLSNIEKRDYETLAITARHQRQRRRHIAAASSIAEAPTVSLWIVPDQEYSIAVSKVDLMHVFKTCDRRDRFAHAREAPPV